MKMILRALGVTVAAVCLWAPAAHASVVIAGTRVVFPAEQGEATVRLINKNTRPALVEAWIDAGDLHSTPDSAHSPFLITPPLFRMNPNKDQSLRILHLQGDKALPSDRESLFWLNVLEIPPKPTGEAAHRNTLQFALRTRIKLFYRPANLPIERTQAPGKLTWTASTTEHGVVLDVQNPTPYYITLSKVTLTVAGQAHDAKVGMVAPHAHLALPVAGLAQAPVAGTAVAYATLNDFGASIDNQGRITP